MSDLSQRYNCPKEASEHTSSTAECWKEMQRELDSFSSLPAEVANSRRHRIEKDIRLLNQVGREIFDLNEYISQYVSVDYAEQRRAANAAVRREWFRFGVLVENQCRCRYCHTTEDLTVDHRLPVFRGGESEVQNLQILCRKCNSSKGAADVAVSV